MINDATRIPRIHHWGKTYSNSTDKVVWVGLSMKWIVSSKQQEMWLKKRVPYVFTYMGAQDFNLEAWSRYGDSESNSFKEPTLRPTGWAKFKRTCNEVDSDIRIAKTIIATNIHLNFYN